MAAKCLDLHSVGGDLVGQGPDYATLLALGYPLPGPPSQSIRSQRVIRKLILTSAIAAVELAFIGLLLPLAPIRVGEVESKVLCIILANWFLICFWLSAGSTKAPYRQLICTGVLVIVGVIASIMDTQPLVAIARALNFIATSWYLYAGFYLPRCLAGIKLAFLDRDRQPRRKRQFGIGALLGFMAVVSVPLACNRMAYILHPPSLIAQPQLISESLFFLMGLAVISAAALPLGIASFSNHRATLKISLSLLWCVVATLIVVHFIPRDYNDIGPIFTLTWCLIALVFLTARLFGVRWEAGQNATDVSSAPWGIRTASQLQAALNQSALIASALACGWLLVFAPILLQFLTFYIASAATPAFILAAHYWRRASLNRFWTAFLVAGALPWTYAMFTSTQEVWALLFGTPAFASTSPVEVTPLSGLNWSDLLAILLSPLVMGALGGALTLASQQILAWHRRRRAHLQVVQAAKPAA